MKVLLRIYTYIVWELDKYPLMQDLNLFHRRCVHKVSVAIFVYICAYIHIYIYICTYTGGAQQVSIDAKFHIISLAWCRECECHNIHKYVRLYIYIYVHIQEEPDEYLLMQDLISFHQRGVENVSVTIITDDAPFNLENFAGTYDRYPIFFLCEFTKQSNTRSNSSNKATHKHTGLFLADIGLFKQTSTYYVGLSRYFPVFVRLCRHI